MDTARHGFRWHAGGLPGPERGFPWNGRPGCGVYAFWTLPGDWRMNHLDEYYRFTGDRAWLETEGYPLMRECAAFFLDVLYEDGEGRAAPAPAV